MKINKLYYWYAQWNKETSRKENSKRIKTINRKKKKQPKIEFQNQNKQRSFKQKLPLLTKRQNLASGRLHRLLVLNVHATNGTPPISGQPLIHTLNMEQMHARQTPHRLALPELAQANRALLEWLWHRTFGCCCWWWRWWWWWWDTGLVVWIIWPRRFCEHLVIES